MSSPASRSPTPTAASRSSSTAALCRAQLDPHRSIRTAHAHIQQHPAITPTEDILKIRHLTPRARISAIVGVTAIGALALSACASGGPSANYVEDGTFVYAISTDIGSLDPALGVTSA